MVGRNERQEERVAARTGKSALLRDNGQAPRYGVWMSPFTSSLLPALPAPGGACRRGGAVVVLSSSFLLGRVAPSPPSAVEIPSLFAGLVPLKLSSSSSASLNLWEAELLRGRSSVLPCWRPKGPGRTPEEAGPLIHYLREKVASSGSIHINALRREVGGRLMAYNLVGYKGGLPVTKRGFGKIRRRYLLVAIRRDVRAMLQVPEGFTRLDADYRSCFGGVAASLSRDSQLQEDVTGDWHARTGAWMVPNGTPEEQRWVGKAVNLPLLHGGGPGVILDALRNNLGATPDDVTGLHGWAKVQVRGWWARYPQLRVLRDDFRRIITYAQSEKCGFAITAPSGRRAHFPPAEVNGSFSRSKTPKGLNRAWTTPWSALFRLVESDVMDAFYRKLAETDIQLGLPIYDGCILAAKKGTETEAVRLVESLGNAAAGSLGIQTVMKATTREEPARPSPA